jgi:asparagine N-glycosylation enzyme membrane subunit Stt3
MAKGKAKEEEISLQDIFKLIKKHQEKLQYVGLAIIVILSYLIRVADMPHMGDGLLGLDPYLFYRYSLDILRTGSIPLNDTMRYYPDGYDTLTEGVLHSYVMAYIYLILKPLINWQFITAFQLYPAIFGALSFIVFYFIVREFFDDVKIALIATAFLSVIPSFLFRTAAGFSDKEAIGVFLIFTAILFFVKSLKAKERFRRLHYGIVSGAAAGLGGMSWGGIVFAFESITA